MITTVIILGVLNLCLGFTFAALAEQTSAGLVALLTGQAAAQPQSPSDAKPASSTLVTTASDASSDDPQSLPRNWLRALSENRINTESDVEALLWTFKLELSKLREQLVNLENQLKKTGNVAMVLGNWRTRHQKWGTCLDEFASVLADDKDDSTNDCIKASLEEFLQDHQFGVEQMATSLTLISCAKEKETNTAATDNSATLGEQLSAQIHEFHGVRDRVDELLVTYLRENGRLDDVDESLQFEGATDVYNRIGLEIFQQQWRDADLQCIEPACCILVDIDRFSQQNAKFLTKIGDDIIAAFGGLLTSQLREGRELDRVARFNGHSYLLFLGDTTLDEASVVAERSRQCIEATSFKVGNDSFGVTTSLGLVDSGSPRRKWGDFCTTLQEAVASAKNAGRNRTCIVRGRHSEIAETQSIKVKGRVIEIAE